MNPSMPNSSGSSVRIHGRKIIGQRSDPDGSLRSSLASSSISSERDLKIKTTKFDKVFIYEFPLTLGDNPAVREGCPVALGSKCIHKTVVDMDSFEKSRRPGSHKRRRPRDLYIPVYDRATLLISQGFSLEKIVQTVLEVERIKKSRHECLKLNGWQKFNYVIDSAGKSIIRKFTIGNSSKVKWSNDKTNANLSGDSVRIKSSRGQKRETVAQAARTA